MGFAPHSSELVHHPPNFISSNLLTHSLQNFTWIATCIVATVQGLVVFTIISSFCGRRPKKPKFKAPKDIRTGGR